MKRNIFYLIISSCIFLLASCQQEDFPDAGTGYLFLADLSVEAPQVNVVSSRAEAEEPMTIEIVNEEGMTVQKLTEAELADRIELAVGKYTLKVYTENYGTDADWTGADKGEAIYYAEQSFEVTAGQTATISVNVPMINFGVKLDLPDNFNTLFPTSTFTVMSGEERQVELKDGETAYFPYEEGATFTYALSVVNTDGEIKSATYHYGEKDPIASGTVYAVTYELATRSFSVSR